MSLIEVVYKHLVRPRVFAMSQEDAELAHEWGLKRLEWLQRGGLRTSIAQAALVYRHPMLKTKVFGLDFANPLGLAAGFDKYCRVYHTAIPATGWGFCEIGGITGHTQAGNDRPRMWRSEVYGALSNFMGFNNPGAERGVAALKYNPGCPIPLGLNVGKSKVTPLEEAAGDYGFTVSKLYRYVDFITINPSSPNTPGLRNLQRKASLLELVRAVQEVGYNICQAQSHEPKRPIGVKISPDLNDEELSDIVEVCLECKVDFIIATNTTVRRDYCPDLPQDRGGISGRPLKSLAHWRLRDLRRVLKGRIPLIGVGGIENGEDLYARITAGADLCQAFTAWPYEGPDFVKRCLQTLVTLLKRDGFSCVSEAVGARL